MDHVCDFRILVGTAPITMMAGMSVPEYRACPCGEQIYVGSHQYNPTELEITMVAKNFKPTEDVQRHLDRADNPTDTFTEYHAWLEKVTGVEHDLKSIVLAVRMYGMFQQHNRDNGGTRTRAAQAGKPVAPKVVATPKTKAPAAEPKTTKRGAAAKPPAEKAPAKPASGRRGKVAAPVDAPY